MFLLTLWANPLARKIAIYAAVGVGIFFALRWYSNRAYYQGMEQGRQAATTEIEKQKAAEWKAREDKITTAASAIKIEKAGLESERTDLNRLRSSLQNSFQQSLATIAASRENSYASVARVPDADLVRAVRALSAELAGSTVAK